MYKRILVPIDSGAASDSGLDEAIRLAHLTQATLRLVHRVDYGSFPNGLDGAVVQTGDVSAILLRAAEALMKTAKDRVERAGLQVDTLLLESPSNSLAEGVYEAAMDWNAELIVIGTHGRRGIGRFLLGSGAEQILRIAPVPVLLVRQSAASNKNTSDPATGQLETPPSARQFSA